MSTIKGDGYGNGNGNGDGDGYGCGCGYGYGYGYGNPPTITEYAAQDNLPAVLHVLGVLS